MVRTAACRPTEAEGSHRRTMVVPDNVVRAVNEGDMTTVVAWLDAGGDVNDTACDVSQFPEGDTLLMCIPQSRGVSS